MKFDNNFTLYKLCYLKNMIIHKIEISNNNCIENAVINFNKGFIYQIENLYNL